MTATEAVKAQMARIMEGEPGDALKRGMEDAAQADVVFAGLEKDEDFKLMAEAHANLIGFCPTRVVLSMLYIGYMAAKMENGNATPDSHLDN